MLLLQKNVKSFPGCLSPLYFLEVYLYLNFGMYWDTFEVTKWLYERQEGKFDVQLKYWKK